MKPVKLCLTYEYAIIATAKVLEQEKISGYIEDRNEMFMAVLKESKGRCNPSIIKDIVDKIHNERY